MVVQVNGKRKGAVMLSPDATEAEALEAAKDLVPGAIERVVYVPGRILNLVLAKK